MNSELITQNSVISARNLGKRYRLRHKRGGYVALRDVLANKLTLSRFFKSQQSTQEDFWALNDLNFEVKKGEVLGIIGPNGAGKSTLLKILSQITPPTEGEIRMRGVVGSLLEVGTGFHPELTGRENIYLNGAILGMRRDQIEKKFEEIVEFSGVKDFLDTPVKRYSSGMQVRLAFAVAAHLEPDILVIDEVLAVGDAAFQKKSLGKMEEVTKEHGRTILFVSHNMDAVAKLCTRCILLEKGRITAMGKPEEVIAEYLQNHQSLAASKVFEPEAQKDIFLNSASVLGDDGRPTNRIQTGSPFKVSLEYTLSRDLKNVYAGVGFIDLKTNMPVLDVLDADTNKEFYAKREKGRYKTEFTFNPNPFNVGRYKLFLHIGTFPATPKTLYKSDGDLAVSFVEGETFITDVLDGKRTSSMLLKVLSKVEKL